MACSIFSSSRVSGIVVGRIILPPMRSRSSAASRSNGTQRWIAGSPASASTFDTEYDMPRLADTVRLKMPSNTLNTSVVAPPMSTPTTWTRSRAASAWMMRPIAPGVGMIGASDQLMSLL